MLSAAWPFLSPWGSSWRDPGVQLLAFFRLKKHLLCGSFSITMWVVYIYIFFYFKDAPAISMSCCGSQEFRYLPENPRSVKHETKTAGFLKKCQGQQMSRAAPVQVELPGPGANSQLRLESSPGALPHQEFPLFSSFSSRRGQGWRPV